MLIGFARVSGQEYGTRVDVDSQRVEGDFYVFSSYDKDGSLKGEVRIPKDKLLGLEAPKRA